MSKKEIKYTVVTCDRCGVEFRIQGNLSYAVVLVDEHHTDRSGSGGCKTTADLCGGCLSDLGKFLARIKAEH